MNVYSLLCRKINFSAAGGFKAALGTTYPLGLLLVISNLIPIFKVTRDSFWIAGFLEFLRRIQNF